MKITAELVKTLRERTGAGMMECKAALVETAGDIDQAADTLRKKGIAKADKKAGRIAAEGTIASALSCAGSRGWRFTPPISRRSSAGAICAPTHAPTLAPC